MARQPNFARGLFTPQNVNKYIGTKQPRYRSGWELAFMRMCDAHPNIVSWASEPLRIPYVNPISGRKTTYVPDFVIQYSDKNGRSHNEVIEIKPFSQTTEERASSQTEQQQAIINKAKWKAAVEWSSKRGLRFRVLTENEIFMKPQKRQSRKRR